MKHLSLLLLVLLGCLSAEAQDDDIQTVGYANVWYQITATPADGGKVFAAASESSLKMWRQDYSLKTTVQVGQLMGAYVMLFYTYAQPADGYIFAGWYADSDGDGQLDIDKDLLLSTNANEIQIDALPDDLAVYDTQAAAKQAAKQDGGYPAAPTQIFALFTNGAIVGMSYFQDEEHGNCGSVYVDKPVNAPGDEVTAMALPNDGFQFEYWQSEPRMGQIVSRENPITFTVEGSERLYAYFSAIDAPSVTLPEEGGFAVLPLNANWVLSDEAMMAGAHVLVMEAEDLTRTDDGRAYLDMTKEDCLIDIAQQNNLPTIVYGKGTVRFSFKMSYGFARKRAAEALVRWSGDKGVTVKGGGEPMYVYGFQPKHGCFTAIGNTDTMVNPDAPDEVKVPAGLAYIVMAGWDLADAEGNIPTVIGLTPETAVEPTTDPDQPKGDVNGDGIVDVADISAVITVMAEPIVPGSSTAVQADVNGDGTVDVADISAVITIMAGN